MEDKAVFTNKDTVSPSIDGTFLDPLTEDTYGLNVAKPALEQSGGEPLAGELENLSHLNLDIPSGTDSTSNDTVNLVSESSTPTELLGQELTQPNQNEPINIDILTGNNQNNSLVGDADENDITVSSTSTVVPAQAAIPTAPGYAIRTEQQININNGGDLDGEPLDISDDALIYAAKGFTINGNITLPVQRDAQGNPLEDSSGKLILVDNAVTVAPNYTTTNASTNQYAGLIPPQVVDEQVIDIPVYADLKQEKLDSFIPEGTPTVTFNSGQNPLNNANDWANNFPPPGTAENPTVVTVTGGGLNIPDNITISNYVITVANGDINFNGNSHNLNNVVLITDNGNINLSQVQATDLSVFASGAINMNSQARYAGSTLLATGTTNGNINFNGATTSINSDDNLRVVSRGRITFNAASDTRGAFESVGDITFNNNSTLYGTIAAKGSITFNNGANVIYVNTNTEPPTINAALANDTAPDNNTNTDSITFDPTVSGSIDNFSDNILLRAGFGDIPVDEYVDITASVSSEGNFTLDLTQLANINGASLADGEYSLKLLLSDLQGNQLNSSEVNFTLDTSNPILLLDTPVSGGNHSSQSRLIGSVSDGGSGLFSTSYSLDGQELSPLTINNQGTNNQGIVNQGTFNQTIATTGLTQGSHNVTLSLFDVAGNSTQTSTDFTVSDDFTIGGDGTSGWGIKTEDSIILGEQNSFVTQTAVDIELGQNEGTRELEFAIDAQFDTTDTNTQSADRLLVYLVDTANPNNTLLDSGEPGTPVFTLSENNAEFTPGLVSYDGNRVKIDLTTLANQTSGSLIFQLINHDGDIGSIVRITDITNTVDSEGVANPLFPTDTYRAEIGEPLNLDTFDTTNDVELLISNVQLDSNTGTYTADLQVRNNGSTTLGRELAVVLTNLPNGVSLNNPSGTHAGGSPYINLSNAIQSGGLTPQGTSDAVQIVFDNPSLTRFELQPVFLTGGEEQPPQLAPIASQSVMPGERLEIPLIATDPNGDPITFSLDADTPLPKVKLTGDGTLIFTPSPDDVGTYNFTVVASAGGVDVTQDVTLVVEPDPITTTRISGVIQNTDQAALGGVVIELGGVQTTTDSNGYFQLEFTGELPSDTLKIRGEELTGDDAYPFIAEKLPLVLEHEVYQGVNNVISRPIYLPALDTANAVTVDPNIDTTVTTSTISGASVFVAAGSLEDQQGNPFTGGLGITEVPPDLTPAALPENLNPDMVVTIQPGEMVFNTPAPLALPNRAGYAPGLEMDLWSINPNTGLFDKVGTGRVSDDGTVIETISGGIRNSSWHFFTPPAPSLNDPNNNPRNKDNKCKNCESTKPVNSEVELHSGVVTETHNLITYQSLGETRGLTLRYDSLRADPRHIVHFGYDDVPANSNNLLVASLAVKEGNFTYEAPGIAPGEYGLSGGENFWSLPASGGEVDAALQVDMGDLDSGRYEYELTTGLQIFTGDSFNGSSTTSTGELINVNRVNSAFGSGWELSGLQEIVENDDGSVLLIDGDGSQLLFTAPTQLGDAYVSPGGDFSTLEKLADGTFRRTMEDQTVYQFNVQNQLELMEDANANETAYVYNIAGELIQIIDPAGLVTQFTYTGNRVTAIIDPAGRVTQLEYDGNGNLVKITDPDSFHRSWEYDNSHRMTAAIDKRGNRGEDIYDFAGRVETAIRPDGSVVQVDAVQTQGLYRPEQTLDPFNAPVANGLGDASASYVDGNGNVVQTLLDQAGQEVSSQDGVGALPSVERDENNLVTTSTDSRGNVTNYTYDENGNVLTIQDSLSLGGQFIDISQTGVLVPGIQNRDDGSALVDLPFEFTFFEGNYNQIAISTNGVLSFGGTNSAYTNNSLESGGSGLSGLPSILPFWDDLETNSNEGAIASIFTQTLGQPGNRQFVIQWHEVEAYNDISETGSITFQAILTEGSNAIEFNYLDVEFAGNTDVVHGQGRSATVGIWNSPTQFQQFSFNETSLSNGLSLIVTESGITEASGSGVGIGLKRYTYDSVFNQVTSFTDELGRITLYEIDPNTGNMLSTTRVVGEVGGDDDVVTSYTYTPDGQVDLMTDALGRVTDYDYDGLGRLIQTTVALGTVDEAVQQFEYDGAGNQTAVIDENGNRTEYVYDAMNRLVQVIEADPDGSGPLASPVTSYTYDVDGNQTAVTDARGNVSSSEYDSMGRLVKITDANGGVNRYIYDNAGNQVLVVDELGRETRTLYDSRNRLIERIYPDGSIYKPKYDFDGNLISDIDALGNSTNKVYDARSRLIREVDALGNVTRYEYDAANQLIATIDANGNRTQYGYDDLGRQFEIIDALGNVTTIEYDKVGNVITNIDARQNITRYTYDHRDRQTVITDANGNTFTIEYDAVGNITATTDQLQRKTQFTYDGLNRQTSVTDPLNYATTYAYDAYGNLIAETDALNRTTQYGYDALNRRTTITNALGDTSTTTYDAVGNVIAVTDELGRKTEFTYDKRDRLIANIDPLNHKTTREYDAEDNLVAITDGLGNKTLYGYDALNRQTTVTDAKNQTTITTYDGVGNILTIADPVGNITTYTYDALNRTIAEENQQGKARSYEYDAVGNRTTIIDRNGRKRAFTYDALNRLNAEKWLDTNDNPNRTINYGYDAASQLITTSDPDSSYNYTYDANGRLTSVNNVGTSGVPNVVIDYTYDGVGNGLSVTDTINGTVSGIESFTYDALNRVIRITQSGNGVAAKRVDMGYDKASQLQNITRYADLGGTQLVTDSSYTYDNGGRLTNLAHNRGTTNLAGYSFAYDAANRVTKFTSADGTSDYTYDDTSQLTGTDHSYQADEAYSYDGNGNRTNAGYENGVDNRLLSDGKYNYEYDSEGNRTKRTEIATGEVTEYVWDYRNRLTQVLTKNAGNITKQVNYTYDVGNQRISKTVDVDGAGSANATVERFVYDNEHIALTFDGDGNLTHRYLHGAVIDQVLADENAQGEVLWALADNQGTVRDVVDATGVVVNHVTYDSFGGVTGESDTGVDFRFGYTGREFDEETGLYYYRARYYDASVGQFISQDLIGFNGGDLNLYRYVSNSPSNYIDPKGLQIQLLIPRIIIPKPIPKIAPPIQLYPPVPLIFRQNLRQPNPTTAPQPGSVPVESKPKPDPNCTRKCPNPIPTFTIDASQTGENLSGSKRTHPNHGRMVAAAQRLNPKWKTLTYKKYPSDAAKTAARDQALEYWIDKYGAAKEYGNQPVRGGLKTRPKYQWDEYPYNASYEAGAGAYAELVPARENGSIGGKFGRWIKANKVEDGCQFKVQVINIDPNALPTFIGDPIYERVYPKLRELLRRPPLKNHPCNRLDFQILYPNICNQTEV